MEDKNFSLELPWTIEQQLKAYADAKGHTERHEILQQSWSQNRRWLAQMLEFTLAGFPNYSQHNETHCRAVIHNIECLLGEAEIHRLSPTDCFTILMTVYLHDVGMCITDADRVKVIQSKEFVDWIEQMEQSTDSEYLNAIKTLKQVSYKFQKTDNTVETKENYQKLYVQKMEVFYALSFLIGEQQRKHHAEIAAERMNQWVDDPAGLQNGFSMTGIPDRVFLMVSQCAALHGILDLEDVMSLLMQLPECDNGFAQDFYHPRFAAALLLIGDALDIDNQRFHPFAQQQAGRLFNKQSEMHYRKHHAIRALQITPERIYIRADCQDPSEMRQLRNEVNWLQEFIKECSYQWAKIAPENFCGCLPVVDFERISLGGMPMSERLVQAQFRLSQEKAFRLLEGVSLYNNQYVYLREMVQNAADAVKFQYWNDLDAADLDTTADIDLCKANETLPLHQYPIKIRFALRKRRKETPDKLEKITVADLSLSDPEPYEFGVEASVQDCGIGIGEEDLSAISKVGTSQEHRQNIIEKMPPWLRPTGRFGIGLQSLFQADNIFWCITRTRRDECYKMIFHSGTRNEGYINVIPKDYREGDHGGVHYGTQFTVFVPVNGTSLSGDGLGQPKMDPFHKDYQRGAVLRQSFKMMKQMENYLDGEIGENIFPLRLEEEPLDVSLEQEGWSEWIMPRQIRPLRRLKCTVLGASSKERAVDCGSTTCWLFKQFTQPPSHKFLRGQLSDENGSAYYLDVDGCKLYIWSQNAKCFFTCGATRIIQAITPDESLKRKPEKPEEYGTKIRLFLKGLLVTDIKYAGNELIETIDIKNDSLQRYLFMNRSALRPEGEEHVRKEIIPLLHQTFRAVLQDINSKAIRQLEHNRMLLKERICGQYQTIYREFVPQEDRTSEYYLLLKKLDALDLSNFILVKNDFNWAMEAEKSEVRERLDRVFHIEKNGLFDCVANADFSTLTKIVEEREGGSNKSGDNANGETPVLSSCRQRMKNYLHTQVNLWKEEELDCVSYLLNKLVKLLEDIDHQMVDRNGELLPSKMSTLSRKIERLREYVVLYAMFFFYMNKEGLPGPSVCVETENNWCGWEYINFRISEALKHSHIIFQDLLSKGDSRITCYSNTLFIPGCKEGKERSYRNLTPGGYSFAELMRNDRHFAVFSTRVSPHDPWKHLLVELSPLHSAYKEIEKDGVIALPGIPQPTILDVLEHTPKNQKECGSRWAFFEEWNASVISQMSYNWTSFRNPNGEGKRSMSNVAVDELIWGNELTRWIVRKLPSISIGADAAGDNRLNVLIRRAQAHMFFDSRMVSLMVTRMKKQYVEHNDLRFSVPVWDGLDALRCREIPLGVAEVNRGVMPAANKDSRMLLVMGSELPPGCHRPEENVFAKRETALPESIKTSFDLLEEWKASYENPEENPMFRFPPVMRICHEYTSIMQMVPFSDGFIDSDMEVLRMIRVHCSKNGIQIDRSLAARDNKTLQSAVQDIYWSYFEDHIREQVAQPARYTEIDLPQDRQKFINSFLIEIFVPGKIQNEEDSFFVDIPHYSKEEFDDALLRVYSAMDYCEMAPRDYRDTFLECACAWYQEEVWKKDSSTKTFLRVSQELCGGTLPELEMLYMTQLRRLLCATIIDSKPQMFRDDLLTAVKRMKKGRTRRYTW